MQRTYRRDFPAMLSPFGALMRYIIKLDNMNNRILSALYCAVAVVPSMAQTAFPDSLKTKELNEVVFEAANQSTSATLSTYYPSARQKNAARDATSLLAQMAIPQIDVDPIGKAVKTASGQEVSVFIDFLPATQQDLQGMRTQDVKKVEYHLHPTDPRFQGAHYAINFIMQRYEWGGYTKLMADKWLGVNRTEGSLYSKMAYKRMIFDVYADEIYLTDKHGGMKSTETFRFDDLYGHGPQTVLRTSETNSSLYRNNSNDIALRALYNNDKVRISNRLSYSLTHNPHNDAVNSLTYSSDFLPASAATTLASRHNWALSYRGDYFFILSPKLSLDVQANYTYGKNRSNSFYTTGEDLSITNDASEDAHKLIINPQLQWRINKRNRLMPYVATVQMRNLIDYFGSSPSRQKYNIGAYFMGSKYALSLDQWNIGADFGWLWVNNSISDNRVRDNYPTVRAYATFSPTDKHQLELGWRYAGDVPEASQKSPNRLQQDELMWYQGTPDMKNYTRHSVELTYTWLPSNTWQLSADAYFYDLMDRCVTIYSPTAPEGTMLRRYVNDGDYRSGMLGLSATGKFFRNKLVVKLRPQYWLRKTTGAYARTRNELTCTAQLTWYFGNFYLWGWYMTPSHHQEEQSGIVTRTPSQYQVELGWGNKGWNISASAYNFLRTSWEASRQTLSSKYYAFDRREFSTAQHWRVSLSVTYTIGYGKKVSRSDEVSGSGTAGSAILK